MTTSRGSCRSPPDSCSSAIGSSTLWRSRRQSGSRAWRYGRRLLLAVGVVLAAGVVLLPTSIAYVVTHAARAEVPRTELGTAFEDVQFRTSDGLLLKGWYIPSKNGAAVIAFPGRSGPQKQARMLASHGYGVLLFDRRGEGESEGDPNAFGWGESGISMPLRRISARCRTLTRTGSAPSASLSEARC